MQTRIFRRDWLTFFAILTLALALRLIGLDGQLWYDEIITVETHIRLPWAEMMSEYAMNHHYFFSVQSKLSVALFGQSPWALRLPAVLLGVGSIALMWYLARRWVGTGQAHVTALLLTLSYHHIWFSQNARGYTGLMFFSVLGTILFLEGLKRGSRWIWIAYAVVLALAVYTHLTGIFFFVAHGMAWLAWIAWRGINGRLTRPDVLGPLLGFVAGLALTVLLYAPILSSVIESAASVGGTSAVDEMQEYQNPLWTIGEVIRTTVGGAGLATQLVGWAVLATMILGAISMHRRAPLIAPITLLHIVLTVVLLMTIGMRIWPRFFFVDIGFLLLMIVAGAGVIATGMAAVLRGWPGGLGHRRPLFLIGAAIMVFVSAGMAVRNYTAPKQDLAGAFTYIEEERSPGDSVMVLGVVGRVFTEHFGADWTVLEEDIVQTAPDSGTQFIVYAFPSRTERSHAALLAGLDGEFEQVRVFPGSLGDGEVIVYRSR